MGSIATENSNSATDLNGHRKSVSFVDEKLIMDALNSSQSNKSNNGINGSNGQIRTNLHSNSNSSSQSSIDSNNQQQQYNNNRSNNKNHRKQNYHHNNNHQSNQSDNWRQRPQAPSGGANGQQQQANNNSNNKQNKYGGGGGNSNNNNNNNGNYKSKGVPTDGAPVNAKNPVIIYYNDPKVEPINVVKELLSTSQQNGATNHNSKSTNSPSPSPSYPSANNNNSGNNQKHQNQKNNRNGNQNGYNRSNGSKSPENGSASGSNRNNKPFSGPGSMQNGSNETMAPKSEPLTIYYTAPDVSIEENLKQLNLKKLDQVFVTEQPKSVESAPNGEINNNVPKLNSSKIEQEKTVATNHDNNSQQQPEVSSQVDNQSKSSTDVATTVANNVIKSNNIEQKLQQLAPEMVLGAADGATLETTVVPDIYDVINGGASIQSPIVPQTASRHPVICTLVSHPSHFYVKFVNRQLEKELDDMCQFYNSDEHIDLSLDVLKPFQYFAAARVMREEGKESKEPKKGWIRVQLLHVESADMINCLLIDEGCFGAFKLTELQPLYSQFRTIPKQAIRASLYGVKPREIDWLPNQVLEFQSLVSERRLHTGEQQFNQAQFDREQAIEIKLFLADDYFEDDGTIIKDKSVADILVEKELAAAAASVPATN